MSVTLALSTLCENPERRTGLTTFFQGFVAAARREFPAVSWLVFLGPNSPWEGNDASVELVRIFPANNRKAARLWADHFQVAPAAKARGACVLVTVGFVPLRTAGLPVAMHVFSLHHLRSGGGLGDWYRRAAIARGLREAALIIPNSRWTARQLRAPTERTLVSLEGVDHARFKSEGARGAEGLPAEYILWASNFYPYKRAELAIAVYARLPRQLRQRFPLVLIGGDWNGGLARARESARMAGVLQEVRFLGWVDDAMLPAMLRGARVHVLSTQEETFGRSVVEAMACGCPCLLQDLPVLREVAGTAAVFCDYTDAGTAAAALEKICTDEDWAARLRREGLRQAARLSYERLARERVSALLKIVETDS